MSCIYCLSIIKSKLFSEFNSSSKHMTGGKLTNIITTCPWIDFQSVKFYSNIRNKENK